MLPCLSDEHTCTIDWLARYSCPYWVYSLLLLRGPALGAIACWTVLLTCQKLTGKFSALASSCSSICSCVCCCCCSSSSSSPSPPATPVVINSDYHLPPPPPPPTRPSKTANFISRSSMLQSKSHLLPSCCRTSSFSSSTSSSNQHSSSDLHHGDQPSVPPNSANTNTLSSLEQQNSSLAIHQKRKSSSTTKQKSRNRIFCRHSSSRENDNVSPKQPSNSYSSYHRPSSSTGSGNELRSEAYSLSPSLLQIRESNGGGVVGISNSSYVLSSHTSSSSAALLSHHSRSNVLTPSREIASITTACWLFLVATVPKLIDSGCQACLAPSPYPVITDEAPSPPLVHATVAKRGADYELFSKENSFFEPSFFFSFLDETTSCVLLPLLLLACHSRLRFSLILIIACLLSCCRGLSCRGHRGQSGQRRPRKWCWSFGQSSSTAAAAARSSRSSSLRTSRTGGVGVNSTLSSQRYPSHHPFHHHLPTFHLSASSSAASSRQASIFPPPPPVFDESNLSAEFSGAGGSFLRINYPANSGSAAVASGERSLAVTIM